MKITPLTIELDEEEISKAISYYLTRMGYAAKEDEDMQTVNDSDFQVELNADMISETIHGHNRVQVSAKAVKHK